jgi:hypothetical protein
MSRQKQRGVVAVTADEWLSSKCSNVYCRTPSDPVRLGPDPYMSEIHDDHTPVALCAACRRARALEV